VAIFFCAFGGREGGSFKVRDFYLSKYTYGLISSKTPLKVGHIDCSYHSLVKKFIYLWISSLFGPNWLEESTLSPTIPPLLSILGIYP